MRAVSKLWTRHSVPHLSLIPSLEVKIDTEFVEYREIDFDELLGRIEILKADFLSIMTEIITGFSSRLLTHAAPPHHLSVSVPSG